MRVSVVIRSKDEADRLRLVLTSLACQSMAPEDVVVVNDGSADHTPAVLREAAKLLPLKVVNHETARGRSAASNAGARAASGEVCVFLDGDILASPNFVAGHADAHRDRPRLVARGETWHLRSTRFLQNPETGTPQPGQEQRLARISAAERLGMLVTRDDITGNFASIQRRSQAAIYPGVGPRRLYDLEMDALRRHPDCGVLWAAASGNNLSIEREDFLRVGGFCDEMDITEQRELALRLCQSGCRMAAAEGARTYHLTHRAGWRDPLERQDWEALFFQRHPIEAVKLLAILWASLSDGNRIPERARISSLPELEAAAKGGTGIDYDEIRERYLGLPAPSRLSGAVA